MDNIESPSLHHSIFIIFAKNTIRSIAAIFFVEESRDNTEHHTS